MTDLYRNYYMPSASDVNDAGQIVGHSKGGGTVSRGPVLLTPSTQRTASSSLTTASLASADGSASLPPTTWQAQTDGRVAVVAFPPELLSEWSNPFSAPAPRAGR